MSHIFDKLDLPISGSGGTSSVSFVNNPKSVAAQFSASVGYTKGQLVYHDNAKKELKSLNDYAYNREQLTAKREKLYTEAYNSAKEISTIRTNAGEQFRASVEREMSFLLMPNVRLEIQRDEVELNSRGIDKIEFLISTNPGEEPKPVSKIASGGEASRVMLALGEDELQGMVNSGETGEAHCHFCGRRHTFTPDELRALLDSARTPS